MQNVDRETVVWFSLFVSLIIKVLYYLIFHIHHFRILTISHTISTQNKNILFHYIYNSLFYNMKNQWKPPRRRNKLIDCSAHFILVQRNPKSIYMT
jgi:hypothetical protein